MKRRHLASSILAFTFVAAIAVGCAQDQPTSITAAPTASEALTATLYEPSRSLSGTFAHASGTVYSFSFRAGESHHIQIAQSGRPVFEQTTNGAHEVVQLQLGGADVLAAGAGDANQFSALVAFTESGNGAEQLAEVMLAVLEQYDGDLQLVGPLGLGLQATDALVQPRGAKDRANLPYATPCDSYNYGKCLEAAETYWEVLNCGAWALICGLAATA